MKKFLTTFLSLALIAIGTLAFTAPAYAANWFNAVGNSSRGWDGSTLYIRSTDSGRNYTFYGTAERCLDTNYNERRGARYNQMSWVMNGNPFIVSITPCINNMVWVCAQDNFGYSGCSGYSTQYVAGGRYF